MCLPPSVFHTAAALVAAQERGFPKMGLRGEPGPSPPFIGDINLLWNLSKILKYPGFLKHKIEIKLGK